MKRRLSTALLIGILLAGISLLLYPTVSDWWNSRHQSEVIVRYTEEVSGMDEDVKSQLWEDAVSYNRELAAKAPHWILDEEERADYESQLDITGTGVMGYLEIPRIGCSLPVYHGTEEAVLSAGAGHLEGSTLPVGGEGTHCILSGHRGLPSAKLLTDLDQMEEGDLFYLHVLGETLSYEVDQIVTVEPDELEELEIQEGQDLCTLVTCTPYGINSHRLLVRGRRILTQKQETDMSVRKTELYGSDGQNIWLPATAGLLSFALAAVILIVWLHGRKRRGKAKRRPGK